MKLKILKNIEIKIKWKIYDNNEMKLKKKIIILGKNY